MAVPSAGFVLLSTYCLPHRHDIRSARAITGRRRCRDHYPDWIHGLHSAWLRRSAQRLSRQIFSARKDHPGHRVAADGGSLFLSIRLHPALRGPCPSASQAVWPGRLRSALLAIFHRPVNAGKRWTKRELVCYRGSGFGCVMLVRCKANITSGSSSEENVQFPTSNIQRITKQQDADCWRVRRTQYFLHFRVSINRGEAQVQFFRFAIQVTRFVREFRLSSGDHAKEEFRFLGLLRTAPNRISKITL